MVRGIGVMRRRSDSYMNATQLLKVAGVEKAKRTRIIERDLVASGGTYQKIQGGYGRYQGTWFVSHHVVGSQCVHCVYVGKQDPVSARLCLS